jgi:hypothetical protein
MVYAGTHEQEFAYLLLLHHRLNRPDLHHAIEPIMPSVLPVLDKYFPSGNPTDAGKVWLILAYAMTHPRLGQAGLSTNAQFWIDYTDQGNLLNQETFLLGCLYGFSTYTTGTGEVTPFGVRL